MNGVDDLSHYPPKPWLTAVSQALLFQRHCSLRRSAQTTLVRSVMGAFAAFARALIKERPRAGIALAKQRGAYQGRKQALSAAQAAELRRRVEAGEQKA
ncbi:MAG: recombinase family protein, partial [Roseiflexaceae bacterium]|nr:recombinase family protein [Roseiflexaceae bacterium]